MRRRPRTFLLLALLPVIRAGACAEQKAGIHIAQYLNDKRAAVTMTFDDTKPSQLKNAKPLFDEFGCRCTFYVCAGAVGPGKQTDWPQWKAAAEAGYEIGNHAFGHWLKGDKSTPEFDEWNKKQIMGGYEEIAKQIGKPPLTFAFPGGSENDYTRKLIADSPHVDYRNHCHKTKGDRIYPEGDTLTAEQAIAHIDKAIAHTKAWHGGELSWFLFYMHDVTDARAAVLRAMLEHIRKNDDKVWCDTYARVTLYEREREQSELKILKQDAAGAAFTLTHKLDPKVFDVPLTVVIPTEKPARKAQAARAGSKTPLETKVLADRILVNVPPGEGEVRVDWQ